MTKGRGPNLCQYGYPEGCAGCPRWSPQVQLCHFDMIKATPKSDPMGDWANWKRELAGAEPKQLETTTGKYIRHIGNQPVDVYDVLKAFNVTNPALQHLIKKALCAGLRGHKDRATDMQEILECAKRALELEVAG